MKLMKRLLAVSFMACGIVFTPSANALVFSDRTTFESELGSIVVDDYEDTGYVWIQDNATMSAVLGETDYTATGWPNLNLVPPPRPIPGNHYYCAGCNGSFQLDFTSTSVGNATGVFGVGFDFYNSGSPLYTAFITYGDGSTENITFDQSSFLDFPDKDFWGITSDLLITSIHFGLVDGGATIDGSFGLDNLTIGSKAAVAVAVEKTWTFTDYNWDPICTEVDIFTGECIATRPANINNPEDEVLADPLAQDGDDNYIVLAQVNKEKFRNTNPGAFYALTTVDVEADISSLTVTEEYADCYVDQGLIQFVSKTASRNVKVAVADPAGDVTELSDDIYDGVGGAITFIDDGAAVVEITDSSHLTEGSTVYVLVKFQDDLKNAAAPDNFFDERCVNAELVDAEIAPDFVVEVDAEAALRITTSP